MIIIIIKTDDIVTRFMVSEILEDVSNIQKWEDTPFTICDPEIFQKSLIIESQLPGVHPVYTSGSALGSSDYSGKISWTYTSPAQYLWDDYFSADQVIANIEYNKSDE